MRFYSGIVVDDKRGVRTEDETSPGRLELEYEPQRRSVRACRQAIADYAEEVGADPSVVSLAVSEAASNVIFHAYRDRDRLPFTVAAEVVDERLIVTVADRGSGMKPNPESSGLGLGLSIIGNVADSVEFDSTSDGLSVTMRFRLES
jgi:serine/threonine-protein kinase RsbW/stage II sporulation protein AB (anti-sigma F factor)